eukprot:c56044_g1_i1 orf=2-235(-)
MVFCDVAEEEMDRALKLFGTHCLTSGSKLNTQKSTTIWLSVGEHAEWTRKYGFQWILKGQVVRYLGFPVGVGIFMWQG